MLVELLTKLGYRTDEEVREELTKRLKEETRKKQKKWEEKLKNLSDSERLDVIEVIVKYETDLKEMRNKIVKVLESREKPKDDDSSDLWLLEKDWFWTPGAAGGYFDPFKYLPRR